MAADVIGAAFLVVFTVIGFVLWSAQRKGHVERRRRRELDNALRLASMNFVHQDPPFNMTARQRELAAEYYADRFARRGDPEDKERVEALQALED